MTEARRHAARTPLQRNIGRPATAALQLAGYEHLEDLDGASARALLKLHGVGPLAVSRLREVLADTGRNLRH